ncbi:terminase small subunit-like protein [Bradyrhizobium elkanii]
MTTEAEIIPPEPKAKRPSEFADEIFDEICDRMANGQGLRKICEDPEMPSRQTFLRWIEKDTGRQAKYQTAREALMDWYAEDIVEIAWDSSKDTIKDGKGEPKANHEWINRSRLKVDTLKFLMAKLHPKKYGERLPEMLAPQQEKTEVTIVKFGWRRPDEDEAVSDDDGIQRVLIEPVHDDNGTPISGGIALRARIKVLEERLGIREKSPEPPKLITWDPGPLPSRMDGDIVLKLVDVIKQNIPQADQRPPEEVLDEVLAECAKALRAKYSNPTAEAAE